MTAMTNWVSPQQGCAYCHNNENLASDELYTKVVARRMIQMVRHINADWKQHVAGTGVTCYTCHRGQPVPANVWFQNPGPPQAMGIARQPRRPERSAPYRPAWRRCPTIRSRPSSRTRSEIRVGLDDGPAGRQPHVDQADRVDLCADDAFLERSA